MKMNFASKIVPAFGTAPTLLLAIVVPSSRATKARMAEPVPARIPREVLLWPFQLAFHHDRRRGRPARFPRHGQTNSQEP